MTQTHLWNEWKSFLWSSPGMQLVSAAVCVVEYPETSNLIVLHILQQNWQHWISVSHCRWKATLALTSSITQGPIQNPASPGAIVPVWLLWMWVLVDRCSPIFPACFRSGGPACKGKKSFNDIWHLYKAFQCWTPPEQTELFSVVLS